MFQDSDVEKKDYSKIEFIINWDDNPVLLTQEGKQVLNVAAKQVIYSTVSADLPDGDYNVYVGKVIERIYTNKNRQVVICLRLPKPEDLSPENLDRQPLTASLSATPPPSPEQAETIKKPYTKEELIRMRKEVIEAEMKTRKIYGGT